MMGSQPSTPVLDPPEPPKETVFEVSEAQEEESTTNLNSKLVGASKTVAGKSQASCGAAKYSGYDGSIIPEIEKPAEQEQLPNFVSACGVEEIQTESCHYRPEAEADQVRLLRAAACLPEPATAPDPRPMPAVAAPDVDLPKPVEEEGGEEKAYILDGRGVCYDPGRFSELM